LISKGALKAPELMIAKVVKVAASPSSQQGTEVLRALLDGGAKVSSRFDGHDHSIPIVAEAGTDTSVQLLLERGAAPDPDTSWTFGHVSPLTLAAMNGHARTA
jgi:hypothetical protein